MNLAAAVTAMELNPELPLPVAPPAVGVGDVAGRCAVGCVSAGRGGRNGPLAPQQGLARVAAVRLAGRPERAAEGSAVVRGSDAAACDAAVAAHCPR